MIPIQDIQTGILFDSRDPFYRYPTGAVPAGTAIGLSLLIPRGECPLSVSVWFSRDGSPAEEIQLTFAENIRQYQRWAATVTPNRTGVFWYTFRIKTSRGEQVYGRDAKNRPVCGRANPSAWQITSYDPALKIPKGWTGGTFYQIFPDRFFRAGKQVRPAGKEYATFRKSGELPNWKREPNGDLDTTDFFGGNLKGIEKKLDYLQDLGITALYLNPIFEARTNHRYDTSDYTKIDPILGTEKDFQSLCAAAHKRGIKIMLDGVFSHTGDDSIYFNSFGTYPEQGAYQSKESPYYPWYKFKKWPDDYEAWWGIKQLPEVDESNPEYQEFIAGKEGILRHWLKAGADGWRFDVADELPDDFLDVAHKAIKEENPDALFIGEVWEDASNKEAYGTRRRYLLGDQLDSVMNYVIKDSVLAFVLTGDSEAFAERMGGLLENYPPCALHCAMNLIGTHDTPRVLTTLTGKALPKDPQAQLEMAFTPQEREEALARLTVADVLMFTLPGIPSVYYGDEAEMWGGHDPLNRQFYPWGRENKDLQALVRKLAHLRKNYPVFKEGDLEILFANQGLVLYRRRDGVHTSVTVAINASQTEKTIDLGTDRTDLLTGKKRKAKTALAPMEAIIIKN
ncbi:MAG: glycoside hydrolase family 13 protein [Clostridia bacterium]|nr:glycoside hydrolase family 13 protein [Clostridia bacterium]